FIPRLYLPISPYFPYTTLSDLDREDLRGLRRGVLCEDLGTAGGDRFLLRESVGLHFQRPCGEQRVRPEAEPVHERREQLGHHREDRKSTRLNSSHVKISYAVFC